MSCCLRLSKVYHLLNLVRSARESISRALHNIIISNNILVSIWNFDESNTL
nr:MAG TPA: hypothetical protein [Caudoviricetes sp.]